MGWILLAALLAPLAVAAVSNAAPATSQVYADLLNQAGPVTAVPVPPPTDRAMEFYHLGMRIWAGRILLVLGVPALFLFTGLSGRLASLIRKRVSRPVLVAALFFWVVWLLNFLVELPLNYYSGFVRLHQFGLSNQSLAKWISDAIKECLFSGVVGMLCVLLGFALIRRFPRGWWWRGGLCAVPLLILSVFFKPIVFDPLFNDFSQMKNRALEKSILTLASKSGIEGARVFEVNKSVDTRTINAYVTGFFGTKRIVIWDTAFSRLSERELLFVMAHEMGHYVLGHVWKGNLSFLVCLLLGLKLVQVGAGWTVNRFSGSLRFGQLSDPAALPLLVLWLQIAALLLTPPGFAYSRHLEHEADRFALETTHDNLAGAVSFARMQEDNLANPRPGLIYRLWRATHESAAERIEFCNQYRPWETSHSLPSPKTIPTPAIPPNP